MPRDTTTHHEQVATTLTILHLRTDLLQRQLARHKDLSVADRSWLATSVGEIAVSVRVLTGLVGAGGGVLEAAQRDAVAGG